MLIKIEWEIEAAYAHRRYKGRKGRRLPAYIPVTPPHAPAWTTKGLANPVSPSLPPLRRGAAFGVAGVVKGLGIMAMKNYGIMDALKVGRSLNPKTRKP